MQATLYSLSKPIGVLRGSPVVADPADDPTLQGVLASPLRDPSGATLTAEDGERWLRELPRQFRSPYLWVGLDEDAEQDFSEALTRFDEAFESKHPRDKGKFTAGSATHTSAAAQKLRPSGKLQGDARTKDYSRQAAHHHRKHRFADDIDKAVQEGSHERLHAALRDAVHQGYMTPEEAGAAWPKEETPAAKEPHEMTRAELLAANQPGGRSGSKTPWSGRTPEPGELRLDPDLGTLEQAQVVNVDDVVLREPIEFGDPRMPDVERYAKWMKEGHTPPPLTAVMGKDGKPVVLNNRRIQAAKMAGVKQLTAWVELTGASGRGLKHKEAIQAALNAGKSVPPEVMKDYPDLSPATPAGRHPLDPASPSQGDAPYDPSIAFRPTPEESAAMRADDWRTRTPGTKEYAAAQAAATPPAPTAAPAKGVTSGPSERRESPPLTPAAPLAVPDVDLPVLRGKPGASAYANTLRAKKLGEAKALVEKAVADLTEKGDDQTAAQVIQAYRNLAARPQADAWIADKAVHGSDMLRHAWKLAFRGFSERRPFPEPRRR